MKTQTSFRVLLFFCILQSMLCLLASAQSTAFTYQGHLTDGDNPAAG